jgi:exodeoxyribonuclease V gamma subunit
VRPRDRLAAWVRLLALTAARPEQPARAVVVGRGERRGLGVAVIEPLGEEASARRTAALAELAKLVDLYDRGMREPLPIACQASAAYARTVRAGGDAVAAAADAWETNWEYEREDRDPEHVLVWGGQRSLSDLLDEPPRAEEVGEGWPEHETSRFGIYALRLWDGLLSREGRREG